MALNGGSIMFHLIFLRSVCKTATHVRIIDWKGFPLSLEYWRVDECKALEVDSVLKIHKKESSIIHKACLNYR
jgi:hypothetical protein